MAPQCRIPLTGEVLDHGCDARRQVTRGIPERVQSLVHTRCKLYVRLVSGCAFCSGFGFSSRRDIKSRVLRLPSFARTLGLLRPRVRPGTYEDRRVNHTTEDIFASCMLSLEDQSAQDDQITKPAVVKNRQWGDVDNLLHGAPLYPVLRSGHGKQPVRPRPSGRHIFDVKGKVLSACRLGVG